MFRGPLAAVVLGPRLLNHPHITPIYGLEKTKAIGISIATAAWANWPTTTDLPLPASHHITFYNEQSGSCQLTLLKADG